MATYDDPRILRAIAHPTRNRVLQELSAAGSLRAADVARLLDIPANQASFHLRQLAKYGLVEEDPDAARDKRDRVWRMTDQDGVRFRVRDMIDQPGGKAAYDVFQRNAVAWGHHLVDRAFAYSDAEDDRKKGISSAALRLTPDEAQELQAEIDAVVAAWRERTSGTDDDDRATYSTYLLIQPYPDLTSPDDRPGTN